MIRMGKSSKPREVEEVLQEQEEYTPAVSLQNDPVSMGAFSESEMMARDIKEGRLSGFVGNGTVLTGETSFDSMLRVDGHLKGTVSSKTGTLIIGSTGQVDAGINVAVAMVNGAVNGDIIATEKLTLGRSARVVGNIRAPRLVMEDGAILEGKCNMVESIENLQSIQTASTPGDGFSSFVLEDKEEILDTEYSRASLIELEDDDSLEEEANAASS